MRNTCPVCLAPVNEGDEVCALCGFKLLGATQHFEPIQVGEEAQAGKAHPNCACVLHVVRGPQAGVTYELTEDEITVGRSPQCSIFLNDMTVSRMHAVLRREGGCYVISDENSFNGVWVNNQDVKVKALKSGDVIQIGTFCLLYEENPA